MSQEMTRLPQAQSLPATPTATNVRTFLDYSGEHTRLTTLHGSTGALEVNNLGGFKLGPIAQTVANSNSNGGSIGSTNGPVGGKLASAFESTIVDGMVKFNGTSGGSAVTSSTTQMNGHISMATNGLSMNGTGVGLSSANTKVGHIVSPSPANGLNSLGLGAAGQDGHISLCHSFSGSGMKTSTTSSPVSHRNAIPTSAFTGNILNPPKSAGPLGSHNRAPGGWGQGAAGLGDLDDEISDVFHGLSFRDPLTAAPGYGRSRLRRSSAPVASLPNAPGSNRAAAIQNGYGLWGGYYGSENHLPVLPDSDDSDECPLPPKQQQPSTTSAFSTSNGTWGTSIQSPAISQNIWGGTVSSSSNRSGTVPTAPGPFQASTGGIPPLPHAHLPPPGTHIGQHQQLQHQQGGSRPNSQTSSYSGSSSDQSGFSPIYSPTGASGFGGFSPINGGLEGSCGGLLTTGPMFSLSGEEREARSPFKVNTQSFISYICLSYCGWGCPVNSHLN